MLRKLLAVLLLASTLPGSGVYAAEETASSPEGEHFFEIHIRPILVEKCQDCHGAKKQWAELRLDSRENLLKGGESGPAAVPGKPAESRLIQVIQYSENDSQMPPDGKLSEEQIARLTEWVSKGAPWPKSAGEEAALDFFQQAATHWAFQPIRQPRIPAMDDSYRIANAVDHFVADKLRGASLPQSPRAEPRALLRRLSFDLTGLPATFEETEAYAANPTDEAYEAQVARLLASPEFGPKWARYWLDIARYADTKGYVFTEERRYPFAYTYRDYVIKAFNEDLPYDQFLREQLAADLLPEKRTDEALAALGFLTVGNRFLNRVQDILDDRIDVTTRGLMGVTLACCRCHDHKFDPLEAADYYALYGVFESSFEPESLPQIGEAQDAEAYAKYLTELNQREQARADYLKQVAEKVTAEVRGHLENYLLAIVQEAGHQMGRYELEAKYELRPRVKEHLLRHLRGNSTDDPVLGLWRRLQNLKDEEFGEAGRDRIGKLLADFEEGRYPGNPVLIQRLREQPPAHMYDVVKLYADLFRLADQTDREIPEAEQAAWAQLRGVWTAESSPLVFTEATVASVFHRDERNKERELTQKIDQLTVNSPGAPPRAMVLADKDQPVSPVIFKRGNPGLRGDPVPRRFLKVLDFVRAEPFGPKSSGRLELAQAITSPENPLTARVLVNRIWMQLIGRPLVESTDDFGLRTPPPTHPELLDYLAYEFMQHGWSVKWLIREIVMSEAYRQTTLTHPTGVRVDIENRLVWRMNRKRLPFESMRDAMLLGAGQLDLRQFGRPEELEGKNPSRRRSVFGYVDRNNVSNLLRTFDVAGPNASVSERARTTVPQQALYVMNSPFIMGLADEIARRLQADTSTTDDRERTRKLYRQLLQRNPSDEETELCLAYLQSADAGGSWRELAQTLLLTNEFLFLD